MEGEPGKATRLLGGAAAADPREPWALYGQQLLAARVSHPERGLLAALDLAQRAPRHPLASVAARLIFDLSGTAGGSDDLILERSGALLKAGLAALKCGTDLLKESYHSLIPLDARSDGAIVVAARR